MLKKISLTTAILLGFLFSLSTTLFADSPEYTGTITKIDAKETTIEVKDQNSRTMTFKVAPNTDIELKQKGTLKFDKDLKFSDLKVGEWVEVEYQNGQGPIYIAEDINVYPKKSN